MARKEDLEESIRRADRLISEHKRIQRLSSKPNEKEQARLDIEEQQN